MANKTLTLDVGRQSILSAEIAFTFEHLADTAVAVKAINLPYGAQIVGGAIIVDEVFNVGTTSVLDIGDVLDADRYAVDVNLKALGRTALTLTGYVSDGEAIYLTPANVGTVATTGKARLLVNYVIAGRAGETQPN